MPTEALSYVGGPVSVPATERIPSGQTLELASVSAQFDGAAASGAFLPCLAVYSQDGKLIARYPSPQQFAVGDSGEVTFATFLGAGGSTTVISPSTPGFTLDYAEAPSGIFNVTAITAASAQLWIQGNPVVYDGASVAKITVWAALASTNRDIVLELYMDGVDQGRIGQYSPASVGMGTSLIGIGHVTPSAGSHTFAIHAWQTAGGTSSLLNPAPFPAVSFQPSHMEIVASSPL